MRRIVRSVAVLTTSRYAMSVSWRQAEFNPRFSGLKSFSTVPGSQAVTSRQRRRLRSGRGRLRYHDNLVMTDDCSDDSP